MRFTGEIITLIMLLGAPRNLAWAPIPVRVIHANPLPRRWYFRGSGGEGTLGEGISSTTASNRLTRTRLTNTQCIYSTPKRTRRTTTGTTLPSSITLPDQLQSIFPKNKNVTPAVHKKKKETTHKTGINGPMMKRMAVSQVTLLSLATALALTTTTVLGCDFTESLRWLPSSSMSPALVANANPLGFGDQIGLGNVGLWSRLILGAYAATPMILLSQLVDQAASRRDTSHVHFATTNMVVALFGRRNRLHHSNPLPLSLEDEREDGTRTLEQDTKGDADPTAGTTNTWQVVLSSAGLSTLTSATEELVFRGYVPSLLFALTHTPAVAWLGQAILFGLGHVHPAAQEGENRIVAATQTFNALFGYGLVYAMSGGDLWSCIVAHALYDLHVLVSSWHRVNTQMDWTEDSLAQQDCRSETSTTMTTTQRGDGHGATALSSLSLSDKVALQNLQQWAGPSLSSETLDICRRFFYAFDEDHKHALSLRNVQRAISYAFLTDPKQPTTLQVERLFYKVLRERRSQ